MPLSNCARTLSTFLKPSTSNLPSLAVGLPDRLDHKGLGGGIPPPECRFHFPPHLYSRIIGVIGDVGPPKWLSFSNVPLELDVVSKAQRQQFTFKRSIRRRLPAPNAETALSIQHLTGFQIALGGCHYIGAKAGRRTRWLITKRRTGNRNTKLQSESAGKALRTYRFYPAAWRIP